MGQLSQCLRCFCYYTQTLSLSQWLIMVNVLTFTVCITCCCCVLVFMVCLVMFACFKKHSTLRRVSFHIYIYSTLYFLTFAFCYIVDCESHLHTSIVWNILIFLLSSCWITLLSVLDKNLVSALANLTSLEICRQNPLDVLQLPDTRTKLEYFMREIS